MVIKDKSKTCFVCVIDYRSLESTVTGVYEGTIGMEIIENGRKFQLINIGDGEVRTVKFPFIKNIQRSPGMSLSMDEMNGTIFNVLWKNPRQVAMIVKEESHVEAAMNRLKQEFFKDRAADLGLSMKEVKRHEEMYALLPLNLKKEYARVTRLTEAGDKDAELEKIKLNKRINEFYNRFAIEGGEDAIRLGLVDAINRSNDGNLENQDFFQKANKKRFTGED